ncbi:centromere protein I [Entomortierella parvispora]|uniref:Centromere protein I n=1 Tax=Entomortierella parvispora TaxID=205924 RepID=A0A9P3H602_9FUNG|nr:centromere protein I [Entomortierella parvispora]
MASDSPEAETTDQVITELTLDEANESVENALERISRNAGVRGGKPAVIRALALLEPLIRHFGLSPDQLTEMLDIILKGKLDDTTARKMIKLLLPRQHVPEMCAVKVLGSLGRQLSYASQAALIRWVILVYDILDSRTKLQQLYGAVFHYLTFETLRVPLCHLLYYLTKREDVKPFRIRKLLDLQIAVGKEPALTGLLHVYKTYFPDLILTPLQLSNQTIFKCPDQSIADSIAILQDRWGYLAEESQTMSLHGSKDPIMRNGAKRQKLSHSSIPDAFSIYRKGSDEKSLPVSQITSLDSLVAHIDTLTLPDQLSSVLANRLLQHVLCLQPSHSIVERISYWLGQELMDLWYWKEKTEVTKARFSTILGRVAELTMMIKDLLPVMENFLIPYLRVWNGVDHQKEIFVLLTYLRPRSYEELYVHILQPLLGTFYLMGPVWKGELILCYTKLLQRWVQFKWKDYLKVGKDHQLSKQAVHEMRRLISHLKSNVDYMQTIRAFIAHVDNLSSVALELESDHIAIQHGVLSFFDLVSSLTVTYNLPLAVVIPSTAIVYRLFLSTSGMAVSRICGIVYQYKKAFETFENEQQLLYEQSVLSSMPTDLSSLPGPPEVPGYSRDYVIIFNSFVMDFCNFLWRNRAFNKTDKNALGFMIDRPTILKTKKICVDGGLSANNMLSFTHSISLSGYSARFLSSLEDLNGVQPEKRLNAPASSPGLQDMISKGGLQLQFEEYRIRYLNHLEACGFDGLSQFLFDSITNLLQRKLQTQDGQKEQRTEQLQESMRNQPQIGESTSTTQS